ncbi:ATP-binding protein [Halocynthiibacter namhaensis]|uniref:hybrid sensor histidine kinase/response regulator n=1 Tax=Halocynthiibacter namhaensis TaxID=1290553 RepID=UPI00068D649F|nr:ATP-binding protein [Halocynthiibacter namhaensis]
MFATVAVCIFAISFVVDTGLLRLICLSAAATLLAFSFLWHIFRRTKPMAPGVLRQFNFVAGGDSSPCFVTSKDGAILWRNTAADDRLGDSAPDTLAGAFRDVFANPAAVLFRLQNRAQAVGSAREDVSARRGQTRLAVHLIEAELFLWRVEDFGERTSNSRGAEGMSLPMLTASKSGTVLFMNEAMRRVLGGRVKTLDRIFTTLPVRPGQRNSISTPDGPMPALVAEVSGAGGRQELYLIPGNSELPATINADVSDTEAPLQSASPPSMFEDLPVPLLKILPGGRVETANRLARKMLSIPDDGDFTVSELIEGLGRSVRDWLNEALDGRGLTRSEIIRARLPEPERFLQITLTRRTENSGHVLIAVLTDATELKTLEAQFVQSQKMQAIGQLAGGVAHDFNNLLTAITGHCDLLMLRHDQGDPDYADLIQINENANRAASLVGQLLAFSRKQNLQPEVLDLRGAVADLTHLLNRLVGEKVTLTLSHDPQLKSIRADKRQLEQVLMNLVVNARDAMPEGGEIRIETSNCILSEPLHRDRATVPDGEYAVVRVSDQGTGITPDKIAKIFEPFYTTKRTGEGTGLGLSMAYGIVKQTGGYIFVDSEPGQGSIFTLYFPTFILHETVPEVAAITTNEAPAVDSAEPQHADGVVLLVEDEAPVRAFASRALRMRGYTVLEADCAEQALETLEDSALNVDLFVTDVVMPGMDGPSWVREALKKRPDVKVVFVSGYAEDVFNETDEVIPNSVFLPKPFSLSDLTKTVHRQLH